MLRKLWASQEEYELDKANFIKRNTWGSEPVDEKLITDWEGGVPERYPTDEEIRTKFNALIDRVDAYNASRAEG